MKQQPKYRPKWHWTTFGCLLPGYWFKARPHQETWWIKFDATTATSENRALKITLGDKFPVVIDLSLPLNRCLIQKSAGQIPPAHKP